MGGLLERRLANPQNSLNFGYVESVLLCVGSVYYLLTVARRSSDNFYTDSKNPLC
jgi:hypothetical protein